MRDPGVVVVDRSKTAPAVAAHAYAWDVEGDPRFVQRTLDAGIRDVTLAASYHATRAATPMHPLHRLVEARHAALYRPLRTAAWAGHRLTPGVADWMSAEDPFGAAASALDAAGMRVTAWIVLTHSTLVGTAHPDVVVRNCFGDGYSYALCPSHPDVRAYATTVTAEAVRDVPVSGVSLEAWGQLGIEHNGLHEKTAGAFSPAAARVLSVCCCGSCRSAWADRGLDPARTVHQLRVAVDLLRDGEAPAGATVAELMGTGVAAALLDARRSAADALLREALSALRSSAPTARVTLHGDPDPWSTGAATALTPYAAEVADAVLVPAWAQTPASLDSVAAARHALPQRVAVGAYLTVLPPADVATVDTHAAALLAAGADELHLYHLGLAPPAGQAAIARIARRASTGTNGSSGEA